MMEQIKKLRDQTGCGVSDCKSALEEAAGDLTMATEILRKKGVAKAAKRAGREATEGIIIAETNSDNTEGYMLEVNSETDFVARNEQFQNFVKKIFELVKEKKPQSRDELLKLELGNGTVESELETLSGTIGEKLGIKDVIVLAGDIVSAYIHGGGRIGVLISLSSGEAKLARDIAMQVAAANPKYLTPDNVPTEEIEKEKEIYHEQLLKEGKPEEMIEKILTGKINKYFQEVCLLKQEYIKDDSQKVEDILGEAKVDKFVRFAL